MAQVTRRGAILGSVAAAGAAGLGAIGLLAANRTAEAQASRRTLIERRESQYNTIYVVRQGTVVTMMFGVNEQLFSESAYDTADPGRLVFQYTQMMMAGLAYPSQPRMILEIGLGGGRMASYIRDEMSDASITCVELDPAVIELAREHFALREDSRLRVVQGDGRIHLDRNRDTYDMIKLDAYRGTFVPFHLTTREFYQLCRRRLRTGGCVTQNIAPDTLLYDAAIATMKEVFANVDEYWTGSSLGTSSVIAVAYDGPRKTAQQLASAAQALQTRYSFRHALPDIVARRREQPLPTGGRVLTDDFAPVESLRAIERNNARRQ
ncbi:MAG: fused MFS/spermidine synthase [Alphaproteobacteria bacterium]|nr:fused MFS/spermidine synthase [Alphaproteobacteria bacterium]